MKVDTIVIFPDLLLSGAILHIALRRRPDTDQADASALRILRGAYFEVIGEIHSAESAQRVLRSGSATEDGSADKPAVK
jgi:hypothetical protein